MNAKFTILIILMFCIVSCTQNSKKTNISEKDTNTIILSNTISLLSIEDPRSDLLKNTKIGDNRFIGITGYACFAPGVAQNEQKLIKQYGIHCLEGTSDAIESIEHGKLINVASTYAKKYNELLIEALLGKEP